MRQPDWTRKVGMVATFAVMIAILVFSLEKSSDVPKISWIPFMDKGAHAAAYGALGCAVGLWWLPQEKKGKTFLICFLCVVAYGGLFEILQPFFGRGREALDLLADAIGGCLGLCIPTVLFRLKELSGGRHGA